MGFIEAFKAILKRIAANIMAAVDRLTDQDVLVTKDGDIIVREPAIKWLSDKVSAVVLVSAAMLFMFAPVGSDKTVAIGDRLIRMATYLWEGSDAAPSAVQEAG